MSMMSAPDARKRVCRLAYRLERQPGRVIDLGDDLDVPRAVVPREFGAAEVTRNLAKVLWPLLHGNSNLLRNDLRVALTQSRNENKVSVLWRFERPRNPGRRHQRRNRDAERGHVVCERRGHFTQNPPQRWLRESSRHEQDSSLRESSGVGGTNRQCPRPCD